MRERVCRPRRFQTNHEAAAVAAFLSKVSRATRMTSCSAGGSAIRRSTIRVLTAGSDFSTYLRNAAFKVEFGAVSFDPLSDASRPPGRCFADAASRSRRHLTAVPLRW